MELERKMYRQNKCTWHLIDINQPEPERPLNNLSPSNSLCALGDGIAL